MSSRSSSFTHPRSRVCSTFRSFTIALYCSIPICSFTVGRFVMRFARSPKRSVERVSVMLYAAGETVMIKDVFEFPPRESERRRVRTESRYGTCRLRVVSAMMTLPSALSDLLIVCASFIVCPVAAVFFTISEPARSMSTSFDSFDTVVRMLRFVTVTVKTECDREESWFIRVDAMARCTLPRIMISSTSVGLLV